LGLRQTYFPILTQVVLGRTATIHGTKVGNKLGMAGCAAACPDALAIAMNAAATTKKTDQLVFTGEDFEVKASDDIGFQYRGARRLERRRLQL
jgi:hypothetical protein